MLDTSTQLRLTGLASGLDTDAIIKSLGKAHAVRIDKVKRDKQTLLWKQEAYRSTINMVNTLLKSSFNTANPAGNFRSPNAFAKFSYNLSLGSFIDEQSKAKVSSIVSVTANGDLKKFNQTIESVAQLATKDKWSGDKIDLAGITTKGFDIEKLGSMGLTGFQANYAVFTLSIDGVSRTIQIDGQKIQAIYDGSGAYTDAASGTNPAVTYNNPASGSVNTADPDVLSKYFVEVNGSKVSAQDYFDNLIGTYFQGTGINNFEDAVNTGAVSINADGEISFNLNQAQIDALPIDQGAKDFLTNNILGKSFQLQEQSIDIDNSYIYMSAGGNGRYVSVKDYLENVVKLDSSQIQNIIDAGGLNTGMGVSDLESVIGGADLDSDQIAALANLKEASTTTLFKAGDAAGVKEYAAKEFAKLLNAEIVKLFGKDYSGIASEKNGELLFSKSGSNITIGEVTGFNTLDAFGLKGGATSSVNQKKLDGFDFGDLFKYSDKATLRINNREIEISKSDSMVTVMSKINNSGAGVNLSYDSAGDRFVLTSTQEGSANNISMITGDAAKFFEGLGIGKAVEAELIVGAEFDNNGNFTGYNTMPLHILAIDGKIDESYYVSAGVIGGISSLVVRDNDGNITGKIDIADSAALDAALASGKAGTREEGKNLIAMINGEKYVRQSNSFTHDGMSFNFTETFNTARYVNGEFLTDAELNADTVLKDSLDPAIKIQVNKNTADLVESIKSFVEEYNSIVDHINGLLNEKRDRSYTPLTEEEKAALSEKDAELYEAKAKSGLLRSDSELRKLLDNMRSAIYSQVEGVGLTMSEIGITTSPNWKDGGRLVIDENKLTNAIDNRYEDVVALFTKPEVKIPEVRDDKGNIVKAAVVEKQGGVALRLYNIFNDAVGLTGTKGYLVNKAGAVNDGTQYQNQIQKKLDDYDKRLDTLLERWYRQENQYYKMFARLESAMMKMQSQQNSLASLMAQNGG